MEKHEVKKTPYETGCAEANGIRLPAGVQIVEPMAIRQRRKDLGLPDVKEHCIAVRLPCSEAVIELAQQNKRADKRAGEKREKDWSRWDLSTLAEMAAGRKPYPSDENGLGRSWDTARLTDREQEQTVGVAGFAPSVPDYLRGMPMHMRCLQETDSESTRAPLAIYMSSVASGGIEASEAAKVTAAYLSLALSLSSMRPVELVNVCSVSLPQDIRLPIDLDGRTARTVCNITLLTSIPIGVVSAEQLATVLCLDFQRMAAYLAAEKIQQFVTGISDDGGLLRWPQINDRPIHGENMTIKHLSMIAGTDEENSILLPPVYIGSPALKNPKKWLDGMLDKFMGTDQWQGIATTGEENADAF